jgi:sugar phosphate isomerase/epimerase
MRLLGLKLWSNDVIANKEFVATAEKALKEGVFGYIEVFALPESFEHTKAFFESNIKGIKAVIHAPHTGQNMDISNPEEFENNRKRLKDAQQFADLLDADKIILHPGNGWGEEFLNKSIQQFKAFNDSRLIVENLPAVCSATHKHLHGVTPEEIAYFMKEANCRLCLDFSHAICGANHYKRDVYEVLGEFAALKPAMYHLCDGNINDEVDAHWHYGEGCYDLQRLVTEFTTPDALITMETGHGIPQTVEAWLNDAAYLRRLGA